VTTAKGEETRRRIAWAAWELSGRRGVEQLLCGVSLREVAAEAGLSPSAVTYHFPTMRDLALAMVEEFVDSLSPQPVGAVVDAFGGVEAKSLAATVREAAAANWTVLTSPEEVVFERRLTRCYSATGVEDGGAVVERSLERFNRLWVEELAVVYERAAAAMGLRPVEPFTFKEIAQVIAAMTEGLLHHWMCDPHSVRDELLADLAVVIASVLTAPADQSVALEEISARLPSGAVTAREGRAADVTAAAGVAPLFTDGLDGVTLTEVAEALGWLPDAVLERFGSVRRVAAVSFARHLPEVEQAALRRKGATPAVRLTDAAFELARRVEGDPWCALALHLERLEARARDAATPGSSQPDRGIDLLVPISRQFQTLLPEVRGELPDSCEEPADLLVDMVLGYGSTRPCATLGRVVDLALAVAAPGCSESQRDRR
jgi:AcrR family transcriptional regulator